MHCLFEAPLQFSACQNKWLDESEEIRRLINNYIRRASEFSAYIHPINKHTESLGCAPGINYPALPAATHRQPWVYFIYTHTHSRRDKYALARVSIYAGTYLQTLSHSLAAAAAERQNNNNAARSIKGRALKFPRSDPHLYKTIKHLSRLLP